ncbi:NAD-dependent epimerase/dehydratase family protein [Hylemonella sp. W303a]|uniref:NAD-dependent epimerase/dehydratase family protein n=1 Tax=Hylemonella sp. W303a TaxID=3389873 RepID=UPI00396B2667
MPDNNIFITGGAGFIGTRLAKALTQKNPGIRIWVLDNLHPQVHGPDAQAPRLGEHVTFLRGDVSNPEDIHRAMRAAQPAVVYHLAAETGTGQSYDEPARYSSVNVMGTAHLVEAVRQSGTVQRVVLSASRAVYGEGAYRDQRGNICVGLPREAADMADGRFDVPLPAGFLGPGSPAPSRAGMALAPASVYASTKLMQEYLLTQAGEGATWRATMLRFQNVYGDGQSLRNPYTGVLSIFAQQLIQGKELAIFEDGDIARDFVYVDDVVDALVRAGDKQLPHGTVLDIGMGKAVSILGVAKLLMKALGRSEDAYRITGAFRVGDIRHACADITAAGELLDWKPRVSVEEGIARLARWAQVQFKNP